MAATITPSRSRGVRRTRGLPDSGWLERIPAWVSAGAVLVVALAFSAYLRTRLISGQFWMDEAITTGIASHPLGQIPGVLRHDGSPPLFYLLLHFWIGAFGASETATHALSLLFGLLTVPVGMWAGWSLFGRRVGIIAAILFAANAWLTVYATETRMYELMALLGLIATTAFVHAFVNRRRGYLILFAVTEALMLYTHGWGIFFGVGAALALIPVWRTSEDRSALVRDALLAFGGAVILFVPWIPSFLYQATHTGAPWLARPGFGAPILISRDLLGGYQVAIALLIAVLVGLLPVATGRLGDPRQRTILWTLISLGIATLFIAWLSSQLTPAFVSRYFAPVLATVLLLAAWGCARSGLIGWIAVLVAVVSAFNVAAYGHPNKSNMREVAGEVAPLLRPGDLVISGQPEQVPLAWYYLPADLKYANTIGPVPDPRYMNWVDALKRFQDARPQATLGPLLAGLKPGQRLLWVRPITQGVNNWESPWTQLIRRRSAQWGAILASDPQLTPIAWAPHSLIAGCCIDDSAILYQVK